VIGQETVLDVASKEIGTEIVTGPAKEIEKPLTRKIAGEASGDRMSVILKPIKVWRKGKSNRVEVVVLFLIALSQAETIRTGQGGIEEGTGVERAIVIRVGKTENGIVEKGRRMLTRREIAHRHRIGGKENRERTIVIAIEAAKEAVKEIGTATEENVTGSMKEPVILSYPGVNERTGTGTGIGLVSGHETERIVIATATEAANETGTGNEIDLVPGTKTSKSVFAREPVKKLDGTLKSIDRTRKLRASVKEKSARRRNTGRVFRWKWKALLMMKKLNFKRDRSGKKKD